MMYNNIREYSVVEAMKTVKTDETYVEEQPSINVYVYVSILCCCCCLLLLLLLLLKDTVEIRQREKETERNNKILYTI